MGLFTGPAKGWPAYMLQQVVSVTLGLLIVSMSFDFCEPEVAHTYYKVVCVGSPVSPVFPCNSLRVRA